jgi:OOP family OmpA-OmpF porin
LKVSLTGHADKRGSESYNEKLATRRAEAVKSYLVRNLGIDASRVSTVAKGEVSPLSPTMYSINRRVDIQGM